MQQQQQECRDCGESFPYSEDADRCPACVAAILEPDPETVTVTLIAVKTMPDTINVAEIADRACNAAFKSIADDLDAATGVNTFGDFGPGETFTLEQVFALFVRAMAVNNVVLAPVQP